MSAKSVPPSEPSPFEKFRDLTRKLVSVPKKEIDKQEKAYQRKKNRRAKKK